MAIETNIKNDTVFISFNDEKTSNSISAKDWKELKTQIEKFEKSEHKYLVLKEINGNFSSGAQLAENINALMEDVNLAAKALWNCKKPVFAVIDGVCAGAGAWTLPRIIGLQKAKELMMTTKEIDGQTMSELGMLYKLIEKENLDTELSNLIDLLNEQSFISICMIKDQIKQGLDLTISETLDLEGVNQNKRFVHSDAMEGMAAFVEKRKPNYKDKLDS